MGLRLLGGKWCCLAMMYLRMVISFSIGIEWLWLCDGIDASDVSYFLRG